MTITPEVAFALDALKIILSTGMGAGLAFASNLWFQKRERRRKEKAAGNLALTILGLQLSDFVVARKPFLQRRDAVLARMPNAPLWAQAQPTQVYFSDQMKFNLSELQFLYELKQAPIMGELGLAERRYFELAKLIELYGEAASEVQEKLEAAGLLRGDDFCITDAERAMGPRSLALVNGRVEALFMRFNENEQSYVALIEKLRRVLLAEYGPDGVVAGSIKPEYAVTPKEQRKDDGGAVAPRA